MQSFEIKRKELWLYKLADGEMDIWTDVGMASLRCVAQMKLRTDCASFSEVQTTLVSKN